MHFSWLLISRPEFLRTQSSELHHAFCFVFPVFFFSKRLLSALTSGFLGSVLLLFAIFGDQHVSYFFF